MNANEVHSLYRKHVQCKDNSNWHGEYCIVDHIIAREDGYKALLLSARRSGVHECNINDCEEVKQ